MQSRPIPTPDDVRWTHPALLHTTLSQLRQWDAQTAQQPVLVPKADEESWEGTEIDVRRTVL